MRAHQRLGGRRPRGTLAAYRDGLVAAAEGFNRTPGTVDRSRGANGRLTRLSYDGPGTTDDFTEDFSYDSAGRLYRWSHDAAGSSADVTDDFSYDSAGRQYRWSHDASGSSADFTDDLSYDSAGRLYRWSHDAYGSTTDVTEDYSFDSAGRLYRWNRDASGSGADFTDDLSYDSAGRVYRWSFRWYEGLVPALYAYERTGETWLLDLAKKLRTQGVDFEALMATGDVRVPTPRRGLWKWTKHVVNMGMATKAAALSWRIDQRPADRAFASRMIELLEEYHGQVTGMFSGDECLAGKNPLQGSELLRSRRVHVFARAPHVGVRGRRVRRPPGAPCV